MSHSAKSVQRMSELSRASDIDSGWGIEMSSLRCSLQAEDVVRRFVAAADAVLAAKR